MSGAFIPPIVTQVLATVSGAIVSVGIPLVLTKLNKLNKLHTTVFGIQEVSTVGGLVEQVEVNKQNIEKIEENQSKMQSTVQTIKAKLNGEEEQ